MLHLVVFKFSKNKRCRTSVGHRFEIFWGKLILDKLSMTLSNQTEVEICI